MTITDTHPRPLTLPPRRVRSEPRTGLGLRLHLLPRAAALSVTSLFGLALVPFWVTIVALSPLTVLVWLVLPATAVVRAYARANRRAAARVLGTPIPDPYRPTRGEPFTARLRTVLTDPAGWRDVAWMVVHSVCGFALALTQLTLWLSGLFWTVYPLLYAVTPQSAFGRPFGGLFEIHTVAGSFVMLPLAAAAFALWYATAVPLARAEAALTRSLLR